MPATRWGLALATAGTALLTACSGDDAAVPTVAAPTTSSSASAEPSSGAAHASFDFTKPETVATGLEAPWGLAFLPDGSALVAERNKADILQVKVGGGGPAKVYTVPGVEPSGEGGLLGLAVAKDYEKTKLVYAYYTAANDNRIVRFRLDGKDAPKVIFDGLAKASFHNGGRIAFGPDGMLYVGTGDAGDRPSAQDPKAVNGKILRLTPDGKAAPGNPTAGSPVWSMGHRNVQGLAWSPDGTMYGIEFGQDRLDEVNVIEPGKNYGWPEVEGAGSNSKYTNPLVTWSTDDASPSGAAIVDGSLYVAALRGERLWTVPLGGGDPKPELADRYGRLRTVAVAPDGALWLTTSNTDGRGDARDGDDRILRFAAR